MAGRERRTPAAEAESERSTRMLHGRKDHASRLNLGPRRCRHVSLSLGHALTCPGGPGQQGCFGQRQSAWADAQALAQQRK